MTIEKILLDGDEIISAGIPEDEQSKYNINPTFDWSVIDKCNYMCKYCSAGYGNKLTRPVSKLGRVGYNYMAWLPVISKLRLIKNTKWNMSIVGGEPTLHPELNNILKKLNDIKYCAELCLLTNLSKDVNYFEQLTTGMDINRFWLNPSIHFQYYNVENLNKIIQLNKSAQVEPQIMLSDNIEHWDNMERFFNSCIDNDITYQAIYIEPSHGYVSKYTDSFYTRFNKYIDRSSNMKHEPIRVVTKSGKVKWVDCTAIQEHEIKKFKGWNCTTKTWLIKETGDIVNSCTGEPMSLTGKNIACRAICPKETCMCVEWWQYDKHKICS